MSSAHRKNGIPDRWLDYKAVGKRLSGTRFIAFKVPLKPALNRQLPNSDVFDPWELLDTMNKEKQELGLIIDLTFTTRYYKAEDVPESLLCVKIFTAGHDIPSDSTILSFKRAVCKFLRDNADNDKLIGVHCTHGLNRTGYLICRYLIDVDGMDPQEAIELFNSSRGYAIERQNYLQDLQSGPKRSNKGIEESEQEPVRGSATHRPVYSEINSGNKEERPPLSHEPPQHRRFHLKGKKRHSHPYLPRNSQSGGLLPFPGGLVQSPGGPGLLPLPPFPPVRPPTGAPFHPYHWTPQSNSQWPRPFPRVESRAPPPHSECRSVPPYSCEVQSNSPPPHRFLSHQGPHVSGHRTSDSNTYTQDTFEEWEGPKMRHNQRVNQYDYPS